MSGFLLDTSFLSALGNPARPSYDAALRWYQAHDERDLFTCTVVIGEIARGIARLQPGRRRERYRHWLRHEVLPTFGERVLAFDVRAALQWGAFMGDGERAGAIPSNDDAKIAAVASVHGPERRHRQRARLRPARRADRQPAALVGQVSGSSGRSGRSAGRVAQDLQRPLS